MNIATAHKPLSQFALRLSRNVTMRLSLS
jgi:hypothetical protein